ncbi:MAG: dihydroorotase family protein [Theionarchaea archaeon]|nr:dihydroorotase family protein [Theionarchaea archaeon]MBU7037201.1 dihydroorotase family protein [Theionarchaea archaeon]
MLFKNLRVVTSKGTVDCDIQVDHGLITHIGKDIPGEGTDFSGSYTFPSIVDLHVHARDFNQRYKETVKTCTEAAVAGGVTTVVDMPNTDPPVITKEAFEMRKSLFERESVCDFALNFGVVDTMEEISQVTPLFVKVYLSETTGHILFRGDSRELLSLGKPIAVHSDLETTKEWCRLNKGILYVCHVASKPEIEFLRGQQVIREVTPHHLFLTRSDDVLSTVKPPLGREEDRKALWSNLGSIDVIGSDHAPHTLEEKMQGASGIAGIETMLPLLLHARHKELLTLEDIALRLCDIPCKLVNSLLGYRKGFFVGADADFTMIDPGKEWVIDASEFKSKAKHSPFDGWRVRGKVVRTFVKGESVFEADL